MTDVNMPISRILSEMSITVKISGIKIWRIKFYLATKLIKLASKILGCPVIVEVNNG